MIPDLAMRWIRRPAGPRWSVVDLCRRSFDPLFRVTIFLLVLLPSGSLFGVNFKIITFVLILPAAIYRLFHNKRVTPAHIGFLMLVPTAFLLWVVLGSAFGVEMRLATGEFRDLMITCVSSWLMAVDIGSEDEARRLRFLRLVLHAEVAACVLKLGLITLGVVTGTPISAVVDRIIYITGTNLMGSDFGGALGRIQLVSDCLIPFCLYVLLTLRSRLGIRIRNALIIMLLLLASLVFTFSRYFWAFAALAFVLGLLVGKRDRFLGLLLIALGVILTLSLPTLIAIAELRFSADIAGSSDDARRVQIDALDRYAAQAPLFGHGFGSHPNDVIRSVDVPYLYEVQLLALFAQEGIVGLLLMAAVGAYYLWALLPWNRPWRGRLLLRQPSIVLLLGFWLLAGLFNPMLLNSAAAICYGVLKAVSELDDSDSLPTPTPRFRLRFKLPPDRNALPTG